MVFLHGMLYLDILEAKGLPNTDSVGIFNKLSKNKSDPYCSVDLYAGGKKSRRIARTRVIDDNLDPKWYEKFRIALCDEVEELVFDVKDKDVVNTERMCFMVIRGEDVAKMKSSKAWYPLFRQRKHKGSIHVSLRFVLDSPEELTHELMDNYFPLRSGCRVKLYQDAHTPALPPFTDIVAANGEKYRPPCLWVDIADAMNGAKKLIYVLGWGVKADMSIIRERGDSGCRHHEDLGEILKRKATEGVRVLIMVWNEAMSTDVYPPGVMGTHDEETKKYFHGTDVEIVLAPRRKKKARMGDALFVSTTYTHHQKCVIVDKEIDGSSRRRLVAFVGGVDLTDGRYDTPEHPLFKTLRREHRHDFYNGVCQTSKMQGPREPWHDVHMYVEGKAAIDVHENFLERWRCQAADKKGLLLPLTESEFDLKWKPTDDLPTWNVQFFRSINADSAHFNYKKTNRLLSKKGAFFDNSIHRAYVHNIRRAKRFIYIENQYFMGSSASWLKPYDKCTHLVPIEITARIIRAINASEDFRVYIVIPFHPEGDPTTAAVQEMLHWQHRTMEMMYTKVADALRSVGSRAHPTDYLGFFTLGKSEGRSELPGNLEEPPLHSVAWRVRQNLRFMIYVHSKMMIVDDEYIIVGSANINQRSMAGTRDSEMALGAYQTGFTQSDFGDSDIPGDIRTFRLSLWAEHCGCHMKEHMRPASFACMATLRDLGESTLRKFVNPEAKHNDCHLLVYPLRIKHDGQVMVRPDWKEFPDTGGSVTGKNSFFLPDSLTT